MHKFSLNSTFAIGLAIRVFLILIMAPSAIIEWYEPFLKVSTSVFTLDPWSVWILSKGNPSAFPYGLTMWLTFIPMTIFAHLTSLPIIYAYYITIIIADIFLLLILNNLIHDKQRLLIVYWLSPIVILASYGLGLNDLIPALFLVLSIYFVKQVEFKLAGLLLAAAISSKLSMLVALPFFGIYLFNNQALRQYLPSFLLGFGLSTILFWFPFVFSSAGINMLLENAEIVKVYQLAISFGGNISIYIVPLIYLVMLYLAWRVRRINFELFLSIIGMAFLLIVLLTPASPGWFVWYLPFLAIYQAKSDYMGHILVALFSASYVISTLLEIQVQFSNGYVFDMATLLKVNGIFGNHAASILHTGMVAIGIVLIIRIWYEAINRNDFFRLSRKPFVIGISGDSGSGKDTLADSITGLFGSHSVVKLSGDNYHFWDRQKPIWHVMTHLNPRANDLERFSKDLISLIDGKSVLTKYYDHQTGQMSKSFKMKSNDLIIASGLHTLYLPLLRECYNLKIFLEIDEELRKYFKLKRDINLRGHSKKHVLNSLKEREPDSISFIRPQAKHSDLIISLQPIHQKMLDSFDESYNPKLKLVVTMKNGLNELSIHRALVAICGLHVDVMNISDGNDNNKVQITIEGEVSDADIEIVAKILCPNVLQFLDIPPKWDNGMLGLMQLITLCNINHALTKRFI